MSCESCVPVCSIYNCYSVINIGKIDSLNIAVDIYIENIATGRKVKAEDTTSSASGLVSLSGGVWNDMLNSQSEFKLWITKDGGQEKQGIKVYTDTDPDTWDTTEYDCIYFTTTELYQSFGESVTLATQKMLKAGSFV